MDRVEMERTLICKNFFLLKEREQLVKNIFYCIAEPDIEVTVRSGLNEDFIYGIVLEIFKVKPKEDKKKTPPIKTKVVRVDGVAKRVPIDYAREDNSSSTES